MLGERYGHGCGRKEAEFGLKMTDAEFRAANCNDKNNHKKSNIQIDTKWFSE